MLFNSLNFLIFFAAVLSLFYLIAHRYRWILLLSASYYFYMCWNPKYIVLILFSTLINYFAANQMDQVKSKTEKRKYLVLSLSASLGLLFCFKYFNFFNGSLTLLADQWNITYHIPNLKVLLPIGISFYTFQTLSYTIDVYRGDRSSEKHLGLFALYVSFFPQLVAGPIERSTRLLPQFHRQQYFDYQSFKHGLMQLGWGFFKKLVIADRIAILVNQVYNHPTEYKGLSLIIATYFFAFQIYYDFSAYSDIAIGAAKTFGIDLMKNFDRPYFSRSIGEFWKRWHISLSSWFRDYLYFPLGGNRVKSWRWYYNVIVVFLLSGLWHGANWTFLFWGFLHGLYYLISKIISKIKTHFKKDQNSIQGSFLSRFIQVIFTFHLVVFAWIFFRANSMTDAFYIVKNLFVGFQLNVSPYEMGLNSSEFLIAILAICFVESMGVLKERINLQGLMRNMPIVFRWSIYYFFIFTILILGRFEDSFEFIYFQF